MRSIVSDSVGAWPRTTRAEVDRAGVEHDVAEDIRRDPQPRLRLLAPGGHQSDVEDRRLGADEVPRVHLGLDDRGLTRRHLRGAGAAGGAPARGADVQDRYRLAQPVVQEELMAELPPGGPVRRHGPSVEQALCPVRRPGGAHRDGEPEHTPQYVDALLLRDIGGLLPIVPAPP